MSTLIYLQVSYKFSFLFSGILNKIPTLPILNKEKVSGANSESVTNLEYLADSSVAF